MVLEFVFSLETLIGTLIGGPNFDEPGAEHLAQKVDGTDPEVNENAFFPSRRFDHVRIAGQETETKGNYYAAVVKNGKVILFPVRRMFQLRPQLNYMDKAAKKMVSHRQTCGALSQFIPTFRRRRGTLRNRRTKRNWRR